MAVRSFACIRSGLGAAARIRRILTLLVAALGLAMPTAAEVQQWQAASQFRGLDVRISPADGVVRLRDYHAWIVEIRTGDGEPVLGAQIAVDGGMPGHGHGLPSRPQVSGQLGEGRYRIEGMRFNMTGRWLLVLFIRTPEFDDRVDFQLEVKAPALRKGVSTAWSADELRALKSLSLTSLPPLPPEPSNRYADNEDAAALGKRLFFDPRFSVDQSLSCASCHQPERHYTDGKARAEGVNRVGRNTMTVVGSAYFDWFYWDGRRDSLWSQALIPFEAPDEMGSSRLDVVRQVGADASYRAAYEKVFGTFPASLIDADLPVHAGPLGDRAVRDAWYRLDGALQTRINRVYTNIGKAIAAYQRTLLPGEGRFDRYVAGILAGKEGEAGAQLSGPEIAGLKMFIDEEKTNCLQCHNGPLFSNGEFHNVGSGGFEGADLDLGRSLGLHAVLIDEFNCAGPYSDARTEDCEHLRFLSKSSHAPMAGAFKVPSLRDVARTGPYFHDGRFATLEAVMAHYRTPPPAGGHELQPLQLSDEELRQLVAFLGTLGSD